jgi:hypothetical protein
MNKRQGFLLFYNFTEFFITAEVIFSKESRKRGGSQNPNSTTDAK